jgi:hypothetical protein
MADVSLRLAGILFVVMPTIALGGYSLLRFMSRREPGYLDNPARRALFVAGHAHAGVLVMLALIANWYAGEADLSDRWKSLSRSLVAVSPILMPAGFFLSIASPKATAPNRLIWLVYAGALCLVAGTVILGIGLLRAA